MKIFRTKNLHLVASILMLHLFFSVQNLAQTPNFNLTPLSNLPYTQELNDIWGYTDETGIEYALVGTKTGTSIVSLANPASPVQILFIPGFNSVWRDLKTWGDYAYVTADQGKEGLLVIDLAPLPGGTPTYQFWRPQLTFNSDTDTFNRAHNLYIDENGYAYIAGSNISAGETFILDVHTTPGTPIFRGATLPIYAHDAYTRGDTLWTSDINAGTFSVYNVTNKTAPAILANQTTPRNFCHNAWISDDGQTLFTTDEKSNAWIGAFDVSDLSNIEESDRWVTPNANTIPHNVHVFNDYLVISYYTDGIIVLDASRPDNLVEVGRYDTYQGSPSTGFYGSWGAYPFLPSGLVLASDINTGLHVLQPNYQRACWLEGLVTDQSNGANLFGVHVEILSTFSNDDSDLAGIYKTGIGVSGTYNVEYKKAGYIPQIIQVTLTNGIVTTQNIQLVPAVPFSVGGKVVDSLTQSLGLEGIIEFKSSMYSYTTTSDVNGNFSLNILPDNDYEVIVGHWGHHTKLFNLVALDSTAIPTLIYPLKKGYKDEFALDLGWTEFGTAITGNWERGVPNSIYTWQGSVLPEEGDLAGDIGSACLITGNNDNGTFGQDDVDGGATTMVSPSMDLSTANNPILSFYYYFNKPWPANTEDSFVVYMTNGIDTVTLMNTDQPEYAWSAKQEIRILDYISLSNNMRVFFKVNDSNPPTAIEALVDLFEIVDSAATSIAVIDHQNMNIQYHPNPFEQTIHIRYNIDNPQPINLQVFNVLGQIIEEGIIETVQGANHLELGETWQNGVYFITLNKQVLKVVKQ